MRKRQIGPIEQAEKLVTSLRPRKLGTHDGSEDCNLGKPSPYSRFNEFLFTIKHVAVRTKTSSGGKPIVRHEQRVLTVYG